MEIECIGNKQHAEESNIYKCAHPCRGNLLNTDVLKAVASQHNGVAGFFIYDLALSDHVTDEVVNLLPINISSSVVLVVSKSKIQGIVRTCSLRSELY